jgi:oligogalacturonide transport system substrate-binding protein
MPRKTWLVLVVLMLAAGVELWAAARQEAAAGPVQMRFSWWGGDSRHKATLAAIEAYAKTHPNVRIEAEYGGWDGYHPKLATQLAGGAAPDVIQVDVTWLADLVAQGEVFQDLYPMQSKINLSGFDAKFLKDWAVLNGKLQGLPTGINGFTSIYNKSLFDKFGVSAEGAWTWDRVLQDGTRLSQADRKYHFLNQGPAQIGVFVFGPHVNQITGGQIVNSDFTVGFDKASVQQTFEYIQALFKNGCLQPLEQSSLIGSKLNENPKWINGEMALDLDFTSAIMLMKQAAPSQNIQTAAYPVRQAARQSGIIVRPAQLIALNKTTRSMDAAAAFVDWFFNSKDAQLILGLERSVPAVTIARQNLMDARQMDADVARAADWALKNAGDPPNALTTNQEILQIINDVVAKVGYSRATPAEAAGEITQRFAAKLAELKAARK